MKQTLVMKFGGTSVADIAHIRGAADKVKQEFDYGCNIIVVVSAMSGVTNQLVSYVDEACQYYDRAEYDTIVSTGEMVTAGLFALSLQKMGYNARSLTGYDLPIKTTSVHSNARITDIHTHKIQHCFDNNQIVIIPGFQGISETDNRLTTLGRGGSDTSAVAMAVAVKAIRCDIYTDVNGVYTTDPRIVSKARKIPKISYEEMLEYASLGAKVLQTRSVELAMAHQIPIQVLSSLESFIGSQQPGTIVCNKESHMEQQLVTGVAYSKDEAKISILNIDDTPGVSAKIFGPLADAGINVDMIVQNISSDGKTHLTFTAPMRDIDRSLEVLETNKDIIQFGMIKTDKEVSKVSIIGVGMRSHTGVASRMFRILADKGINIQVITTSEIKVSVLVHSDYTELAVRALHMEFNLDKDLTDINAKLAS
ncbi:MAG: aspartate kinase [Alphaproteobacteria bacterium]|jgi:aspartate kinase